MANHAVGWSRDDLEAPQALDYNPGNMLYPASPRSDQQYIQSPELASNDGAGTQYLQSSPDSRAFAKTWSPVTAPVEAKNENGLGAPGPGGRILGLRKTTFFLTLSNILLAIGLIVLGVVQNHVLRDNGGSVTASSVQGSCPGSSSTASSTSTSASSLPTCAPEAGKVCFATDTSTTTAVALGDVISECPISAESRNYTVPGTDLNFMRTCGTDYPSEDMGTFPVLSIYDCIHLCAQLNLYPASARGRCVGVSWVYGDGAQGMGISFCYPKSAITEAQSRAGTESAMLIEE